jgi:hypothetical protein
MQKKARILVAWLIIIIFSTIQFSSAISGIEIIPVDEPILLDNLDGNWTARWDLRNTNNYTLNNIELQDGSAKLKKQNIELIEDESREFNNGTQDNLDFIDSVGLGLDLRRDFYTLIADRDNNRVVEIDYDKWVWQYGSNTTSGSKLGQLNDPTFAYRLDKNMTLITDKNNNRVIAVGRNNEFYWQYGSNNTAGLGEDLLNKPSTALPSSNGNILIADKDNNYVVEVSLNKKIIWQFGYSSIDPKEWPMETSQLSLPTYAEVQQNGFVLITDHNNHRVILVDRTKAIRWQYGSTGSPGSNNGKLDSPTYAIGLTNGNTLITDSNNHRVIEVTPFGVIKWQYGKTKIPGSGRNELRNPSSAIELPNGRYMISDTGNHRTLIVNKTNDVIWHYGNNGSSGYGNGYLNAPKSAFYFKKKMLVGFFISQILDGNDNTNWETLSWEQALPSGTLIFLYTRTGTASSEGQGTWSDWDGDYINSTGENITSPMNRYIQYAAVFLTIDLNITPILKSVKISGFRFEKTGELRTELFSPNGLLSWIKFNCNYRLKDQNIQAYYSLDQSAPWFKIYNNSDLSGVSIVSGLIKFRFQFNTNNISVSPDLNGFSLIYQALAKLDHIVITPNSTAIMAGDVYNFTAIGYDTYGHEVGIDPVWDTDVGEVNNGTFNAQTMTGSGIINATVNEVTGSAIVEIIPGHLHHIEIMPSEVTVIARETQAFTAIGYDQFNNNFAIEPKWSTDVGVMNDNVLSAQNFAGTGTVQAFIGEIIGSANVTIALNSSQHHPPEIRSRIPDQIKPEDSEPWIINLASHEFDLEDDNDKLFWYITDENESLYTTTGSYSELDMITFIPKPDAFGSDKATLWLVDSDNMTDNQPIWINLTPVNDKPIIDNIPDIYIHYEEPYNFDYSNYIFDLETSDSDLILSLIEPDDQSYTSVNGMNVTFNYPKSMFGKEVQITLAVSDGEASSEEIFTLSVTDNHAPVLIKPFPDITLFEGESKEFIFDLDEHFMDPDNDILTFFFNVQSLAVVVHENNTVTISSLGLWSGTESIKFRAMDPFGSIAEGIAKITVLEVNNPPEIIQIPDIYVHYDYNYHFNLSKYIFDPDNITSDLELWTNDPLHITFPGDKNDLMILNYPESFLGQALKITLNVSDRLEMDWCVFTVYITDNFPPTVKNDLIDIYFEEDTELIGAFFLSDYFSDMDDSILTFQYISLDENNISVVINQNSSVNFAALENWFGSTNVYFKAIDHANAFVETGMKVIVIPVNDPPELSAIPIQNGQVGERWILDLAPYISDIDNNITELDIQIDSDFATLTGTQLTFYPYKEVETELQIVVSDGYANTTGIVRIRISKRDNSDNQDLMQMVWVLISFIILIIISVVIVVYRSRTGDFTITDVFLIHKNGVLIKYKGDTLKKDRDEDIIGSMLTAVQSFITDSFAGDNSDNKDDWGLNQLRLGKNEILLERGNNIFMAVIYKGRPGKRLPKIIKEHVKKIEAKYGKILTDWNGSYKELRGIETYIEPMIDTLTENDDRLKL